MRTLAQLRAPCIGLVLAIAVGMTILAAIGDDPRALLEALYNVCFTGFGLGYTLFYSTPLIFTGLSVALCFRCGLFNIGAEGQLYLGSLAVVVVSRYFPNAPWFIGVPFGILASFVAGGVWGGLAGFLKAKRGSHEVITTILLNFVALAITSYVVLGPYHNLEVQNPETFAVGRGYQIPFLSDILSKVGITFFQATPVNGALFVSLIASVLCALFLFKTSYGFSLRAVGYNPHAAEYAGINVPSHTIWTMALSGGLAGMVGVNEVMGYQHKLIEGFSPEYGFTGIAVALLARSNPLGILVSAFLFGALHNSARELEFLSDKAAKELGFVLQGVLIAFVAAHQLYDKWWVPRARSGNARSVLPEPVPPPPLSSAPIASPLGRPND